MSTTTYFYLFIDLAEGVELLGESLRLPSLFHCALVLPVPQPLYTKTELAS